MSWEMVKLSEVSSFIRNGLSIKQDSSLSGVPITRIETISDRTVNLEKCGYADLKPTDNLDYKLEKGDILISHINSPKHLGKSAQFNGEEHLIHGMNLLCLRPSDKVDARYLYLAINSSHFLNQLPNISNKSVNQASFKVSDFKSLNVHLPPLPEQQRIADILDKAEAINQKREQALALCDEFLRATFLDMFGDPVSNPKGWLYEKLDEVILTIKAGKSLAGDSKPANENELGVLKVSAVSYGFFQPQENKKIEKLVDREKLIFPKKGDFLFSRANTRELVGATCIVQDDFGHVFLPDKLWLIDVDSEKVSAYYLHFLMLEPKFKDKLTSQATGTSGSMLNISQKKFVNTIAPIPPIELQQKFSEIVEKVNSIKARIQHAQELPLFDALSQQAFKGELTQ